MLLFVYLFADLDEGRQADSIVKSWGVVEFHYHGWDVKNFDTLPVSDSIPVPNGEYRVIDDYGPLHLKGKWEYYKRDWKTREFKPALGSILKGYPLDLLDWGRYLVFYIRGKGRYEIGIQSVYHGFCGGFLLRDQTLDTSWKKVKIDLTTLRKVFNVYNPPGWIWNQGTSPGCWAWGKDDKGSGFVPLIIGIAPLADTFGTYEYEIELSPIYLVR